MRGESVEKILAVAAQALLERSRGDRAGVWVERDASELSWFGATAQKGEAKSLPEWSTLSPAAFLQRSSRDDAALEFQLENLPPEPSGFYKGMKAAIGLPLELEGHRFGVAIVAGKRDQLLDQSATLQVAANEIAAALSVATARAESALARRELCFRRELDRRVADGAPIEDILRLIAVTAAQLTGAEFAGIAQLNGAAIDWIALSGSEAQAASSHSTLVEVASSILKDGHPAIRQFPSSSSPSAWLAGLELGSGRPERMLLLARYSCEKTVPLEQLRDLASAAAAACHLVKPWDIQPTPAASTLRAEWPENYRDLTNQWQFQQKLLQTEKMAALGQLVSGIAHELNNPLTSIMGYTQLLLARGASSPPNGEAEMIFEEAERARHIVKNLLFFSLQKEPERTRVDVNEIVERTVALRSYELKVENIAVDIDLAAHLPPILADPFQLQQVLLNLLTNAEQAILEGRGQGSIEIRTRKVSHVRLSIEILDDGPGIPQEIASRIFDPFFTTKATDVGTGLGLSIVYGIIEQHGGEVTFANQRDGGVKFTIELPVVAAPVAKQVPPPTPLRDSPQPHPSRVLVVEDEPTVARLVADVLREEGHQVESVLDSQEGLTRISRSPYDLIICDLRMPRLDGPAFYEALVRSGSPARNRILFITGDTLGPRTIEFLKSRQLPYLGKPFLVEELKLAVNRVLQISGTDLMPISSARTG